MSRDEVINGTRVVLTYDFLTRQGLTIPKGAEGNIAAVTSNLIIEREEGPITPVLFGPLIGAIWMPLDAMEKKL